MVQPEGFTPLSHADSHVYGIGKAGLNHLARVAAHEFGPQGIRVNVVAPGLTRTPRVVAGFGESLLAEIEKAIPLRRANDPADIAYAVAFLLSDLARSISGAILPVDGGLSVVSAVPVIGVGAKLKQASESGRNLQTRRQRMAPGDGGRLNDRMRGQNPT